MTPSTIAWTVAWIALLFVTLGILLEWAMRRRNRTAAIEMRIRSTVLAAEAQCTAADRMPAGY